MLRYGSCSDQFLPDGSGGRLVAEGLRCHCTQMGRVFGRQGTDSDGNIRLGAMHGIEYVCVFADCTTGGRCASSKVCCWCSRRVSL